MKDKQKDELTWKVCPAPLHTWKGVCAWVVIIGVGLVIMGTDLILGLVALVFMIASLATFIFPSTFTIDGEGLLAKYPIRKKYYTWKQVRRAKFFDDACYLFTRKKSSFAESRMAVIFGDQQKKISTAIKSHLREDVAT